MPRVLLAGENAGENDCDNDGEKKDTNAMQMQVGFICIQQVELESRLLRFSCILKELQNLSNRDFPAQFVKKSCAYEPNLRFNICIVFFFTVILNEAT